MPYKAIYPPWCLNVNLGISKNGLPRATSAELIDSGHSPLSPACIQCDLRPIIETARGEGRHTNSDDPGRH